MEVIVTKGVTETFQPITLEIKIESEDELLALLHRTNVGTAYLTKYFDQTDAGPRPQGMNLSKLFEAINKLWQARRNGDKRVNDKPNF